MGVINQLIARGPHLVDLIDLVVVYFKKPESNQYQSIVG